MRAIVGRCDECNDVSLYYQEDYGDPIGWATPYRVFPAPARRLSDDVPRAIREDFTEAHRCREIRCHTASVVMFRRVVEGICVDHGYRQRTLSAKLDKMKTDAVIDERLHEWARVCQAVGNIGAHPDASGPVVQEDAQDAADFAEALIDYLYVFQAKHQAYESRRNRKAATT